MDELLLMLTPRDVERALAARLREARRAQGFTQAELASRSGVSVATIARLERSGQGQLSSFVRLCAALNRLDDFEALLKPPPPRSMDELRRLSGP